MRNPIKSHYSGAVGAVLSVMWEGFWLIGPPVGIAGADRRWYLFWGLIALLICGTQAFVVLLRQLHGLERRFDPAFHLWFDPFDKTGTYIETETFGNGVKRRYRMAVVNDSGADLAGLSALVTGKDPHTARVELDRRLRPMAEHIDADGYFNVPRDGRRFVTVAMDWVPNGIKGDGWVRVFYNSETLHRDINGRVKITIKVLGANAPAKSMGFIIDKATSSGHLSIAAFTPDSP